MSQKLKTITRRTEFYVGIVVVLLCIAIQAISGQFFTGNNIVDLIRSFSVPAIFCVGEMFVLISGGTDVSFPAIASMSMYIVCTRLPGNLNLKCSIAGGGSLLVGVDAGISSKLLNTCVHSDKPCVSRVLADDGNFPLRAIALHGSFAGIDNTLDGSIAVGGRGALGGGFSGRIIGAACKHAGNHDYTE